jgi:pimeloyl-ACP methyl ester carboxylesterase
MKKTVLLTIFIYFLLLQGFSQQTEFVKSSDGVNIAYQVYGDGNIPLVFVHGWCCDKSYWKEQTSYLKNQYKIVTVDLAGHGESGLGRKSYTIPMFAMDVSSVINKLGLNKFILIGHSMGVNVILEVAVNNLDKTLAIFPIDGYFEIPKVKTEDELISYDKEQRSEWSKRDFQPYVYEWVRSWYHPESDSVLMDKIALDMSMNDPFAGIDAIVTMMQWYYRDYPNSLKLIKDMPVINIESQFKPNVEEFRNYGVNFQNFHMEGPGHFLHMSNPVEFNKILSEQLDTVLKYEIPQ